MPKLVCAQVTLQNYGSRGILRKISITISEESCTKKVVSEKKIKKILADFSRELLNKQRKWISGGIFEIIPERAGESSACS